MFLRKLSTGRRFTGVGVEEILLSMTVDLSGVSGYFPNSGYGLLHDIESYGSRVPV